MKKKLLIPLFLLGAGQWCMASAPDGWANTFADDARVENVDWDNAKQSDDLWTNRPTFYADTQETVDMQNAGCDIQDTSKDFWAASLNRQQGSNVLTTAEWSVVYDAQYAYYLVKVNVPNPNNVGSGGYAEGNDRRQPAYSGDAVEIFLNGTQYGIGYFERYDANKLFGGTIAENDVVVEDITDNTGAKTGYIVRVRIAHGQDITRENAAFHTEVAVDEVGVRTCNDNNLYGRFAQIRTFGNRNIYAELNGNANAGAAFPLKVVTVEPIEPEVVESKNCAGAAAVKPVLGANTVEELPTSADLVITKGDTNFFGENEKALVWDKTTKFEIKKSDATVLVVGQGSIDYCGQGALTTPQNLPCMEEKKDIADGVLAEWQVALDEEDNLIVFATIYNSGDLVGADDEDEWKTDGFEFYVYGNDNTERTRQVFVRWNEFEGTSHFGDATDGFKAAIFESLLQESGEDSEKGEFWRIKFKVPSQYVAVEETEDGKIVKVEAAVNIRDAKDCSCLSGTVYTWQAGEYNFNNIDRAGDDNTKTQMTNWALNNIHPVLIKPTEEIAVPDLVQAEGVEVNENGAAIYEVFEGQNVTLHANDAANSNADYTWTKNEEVLNEKSATYTAKDLAAQEEPYIFAVTAENDGCQGNALEYEVTVKPRHELPNAIDTSDEGAEAGVNVFAAGLNGTKFYVYTRYGIEVYKEKYGEDTPFKGWNGCWDGKTSKPVDPGVYYYVIKAEDGTHKGAIEVVNPSK